MSKKYTLDNLVDEKSKIFNDSVRGKGDKLPGIVTSRAFTGLLLLTQATKKEQGLTDTIIKIARLLEPIMGDIGTYSIEKYNNLLDPSSSLHNRDYDENEYLSRVVAVYPPLDYILHWYFESEKETPFDLNEYSKLCSIMKKAAEEAFDKSIWSKG